MGIGSLKEKQLETHYVYVDNKSLKILNKLALL